LATRCRGNSSDKPTDGKSSWLGGDGRCLSTPATKNRWKETARQSGNIPKLPKDFPGFTVTQNRNDQRVVLEISLSLVIFIFIFSAAARIACGLHAHAPAHQRRRRVFIFCVSNNIMASPAIHRSSTLRINTAKQKSKVEVADRCRRWSVPAEEGMSLLACQCQSANNRSYDNYASAVFTHFSWCIAYPIQT
jgi:hypothetical protein